jgi:hypothetical protein
MKKYEDSLSQYEMIRLAKKLEIKMLNEELGRVGRDRVLAGMESGDPELARGFLILTRRQ